MPSDILQHDVHKFSDGGLNLRVPVDLIPSGQYSKLTNALPVIEGRLEGRSGLSFIVNVANATAPGSGLHSLIRLNQPAVAGLGDRVLGVDNTIQTLALPAGNTATSRDTNRTGDPLSLPAFHFIADGSAWQVISDRSGMRKYRGFAGAGDYNNLGIPMPSSTLNLAGLFGAIAVGSPNGAGNLNSTGGPGYDWLYTHVNTKTLSEGNPCVVNAGANPDVSDVPFTITTPDPGFGGSAGTGITGGGGVSPVGITLSASSASESRQSVLFSAFQTGPRTFSAAFLQISMDVTVAGTQGAVYWAIYFSLDSGSSWKLAIDGNVSVSQSLLPPFTLALPTTQDPSKIRLRAVALAVGNTTIPQNVTTRRVRDHGGNLQITDLLTGGGGNRTVTFVINDIKFFAQLVGSATNSLALTNQQASVQVSNPFDPQVDALRLYRRGGSVAASWGFVQQFNVTAHDGSRFFVTDNIADNNLGQFVSFTNDVPITSVFALQRPLPYVWGPAFNPSRLLGCGDPDRPDAVYFSNPGNADEWGVGQWVDVSSPSDPMQNGTVFNTRVFAFSKERMFELEPNVTGGSTLVPFETPCRRGLISPWGLVATARAVYFVAKDGIYATSGGVEESLVENNIKPLFPIYDGPGRAVEGYDAVDMERIEDIRLRFHNDELYFIYRGLAGSLQMLIYDQNKNRWRAGSFPVPISTVYSEEGGPKSSLLLGDANGSLYTTAANSGDALQASTPDIPVTIRTGAFDQGMPLNQKEYGNVLVDIDPGGATVARPVTITPLLNGEAITGAAITITGSGRQQIPLPLGDVFGFNIELNIAFVKNSTINPVLYQFDILYRQEPVAVTHWEARETSHGLPGWQHIREIYVSIRSTAVVQLMCTYDGGAQQSYTVPSTAGKRQKVLIPFQSNKFKQVRYSFDSTDQTQPFRLYVSDIEVRVKPWLTNLGYAITKPFGAEGSMTTATFEGDVLGGGQ